jgi:hypothetical protein
MTEGAYRIVTAKQQPDLRPEMSRVGVEGWPDFMVHLHSAVVSEFWSHLYDDHPECQYALVESDTDRVVAIGNSVPVHWDQDLETLPNEGVEWALKSRFDHPSSAHEPNLLCALQIVLTDKLQGRQKSGEMVLAMRKICESLGLNHLIAPVRPNWKHRYPMVPLERYIRWQTDVGLPYDPWMRVHARLGASILNVCSAALTIEGSISDWERWTGMHFPESGAYPIPGALVPVKFDIELNRGLYVEPNVWTLHP